MSFSLAGKTAIVTGGANGVGLAIGRHFVEQGANVMFTDMDEEALQREVMSDFEPDGPARIFAGDLRKKLNVKNLLSATMDAFDGIDILVNASRQVMPTDPLSPDDDSVMMLLEQNMLTALKLSQAVARKMIKLSEDREDETVGTIINLSSIAARRTHPDLMAYSISAAASDQMTRSLAVALAPNRVRVNAVAFGSVMSASLKGKLKEHDDYREDILRHTPLQRIASPLEVCEAVQYLACDASDFVTGQIITVDGGRTLIDAVGCPAH